MRLVVRTREIATTLSGTLKGAEKVRIFNNGQAKAEVAGADLASGDEFLWHCSPGDTLEIDYDAKASTLQITYHSRAEGGNLGNVRIQPD